MDKKDNKPSEMYLRPPYINMHNMYVNWSRHFYKNDTYTQEVIKRYTAYIANNKTDKKK